MMIYGEILVGFLMLMESGSLKLMIVNQVLLMMGTESLDE